MPRPCMLSGRYSIAVRRGVVKPSLYRNVWEFRCCDSADLLVLFAEAPVWHAIVPNPYSGALAAAVGASQFDLPIFTLAGVPLLRTWQKLNSGLIAPARVPLPSPNSRESAQARTSRRARVSARIS